jgi:hypothetical protein
MKNKEIDPCFPARLSPEPLTAAASFPEAGQAWFFLQGELRQPRQG